MKFLSFNLSAKLLAFITVFFWATAFITTKIVLVDTNPYSIGILRYFFALIIVCFIIFKQKLNFPNLKDIPLFFIAGFSGYAGYVILFNTATIYTSPATLSVINSTCPAITAILATFIFKEKINIMGWISFLISFIGVIILTLSKGSLILNVGVVYMFVGAILLSSYNITQRFLTKKYSAFYVSMYSMFFGSVSLILYSPNSIKDMFLISKTSLFLILYMSIFSSILSYFLWTKAFQLAKTTTEVTNFMFVTPILATLMGIIFLKDIPTLRTLIGGTLIIIGMLIFNKTKK